jgi:hypothetical protein
MARLSRFAFPSAALLFLAVPGHSDAWFSGLPVGLWTLALAALFAFAYGRPRIARPTLTGATIAMAVLMIAKITVATVTPSIGWLARYYANGEFAGAPRRSTEFARLAGATRIDRAIDFHDDYLPLYFLNEADFNRGIRREVTEPVSVYWSGHVQAEQALAFRLSAETRGVVRVVVDGVATLEATTGAAVSRDVTLPPGDHLFEVRYIKPADTDPLVRLTGIAAVVTPAGAPGWRLAAAGPSRVASRVLDVLAVLVFGYALCVLLAGLAWSPARVAAAAMLVLFIAQGAFASAHLQRRAVSLSGGDDWMAFEARSRAVATGDVLMLFGQPRGHGDPLYYYPGYIYFLAGVHAIGGEDLSTLVLAHFLLLCCANVVVYQIATLLFDRRVPSIAVATLVVIEELAFIRHYTVTLLSENLYFFTVAWTVYSFVRFVQRGEKRWLIWCAVAGGVSALTRPIMMLYLAPAALIVFVVVAFERRRSVSASVITTALFVGIWFLTISPATLRNYVAAGSPVLICNVPIMSFINYNLPPNVDGSVYRNRYDGTTWSLAKILGGIVVHYPVDTLRSLETKIGFSFGLLQWMGGHVHPELVLASAGYLFAILFCPSARAVPTWPIHAFVLAHLAGMVLSSPSLYGYRLILPMYLFFPMFAVHFAIETWQRMTARLNGGQLLAAASSRTSS